MLVFFAFPVGKTANIPPKYGFPIRTAKICLISVLALFSISRRKIIKSCEKILQNYESSGHNLDTIKYNDTSVQIQKVDTIFLCHSTYFWTLYFRKIKLILCMANYSNARQSLDSKAKSNLFYVITKTFL